MSCRSGGEPPLSLPPTAPTTNSSASAAVTAVVLWCVRAHATAFGCAELAPDSCQNYQPAAAAPSSGLAATWGAVTIRWAAAASSAVPSTGSSTPAALAHLFGR